MPEPEDVTGLLDRLGAGDRNVVDRLLPLVYQKLRELAQRQVRAERRDNSLQATALVHEAYLKLVNQREVKWQNRAHFVAVAGQAIRRILVDHAREKARLKRGGGRDRVVLDEAVAAFERDADLLDLDVALAKLELASPDRARLVEMRFFGGLSMDEIAEVLGVSVATVNREWRFARAWLFRQLESLRATKGGGADER
jgi:RNA polymerase sigma factor (TIGR02999 family)